MKTKLYSFFILLLLCTFCTQAQTFTKVTTGDIGTDKPTGWSSAWGDFDNDGDPDLYVARATTNKLYRNDGNGSFTSITTGNIVTDSKASRGASWGDYDNDGDLDLIVSTFGSDDKIDFYTNNGNGTFTKTTSGTLVSTTGEYNGIGWLDINNDSWLDIVAATYNLAENKVFMGSSTGSFSLLSGESIATDKVNSIGLAFGDYDNDGDVDAFMAGEGNNLLYINNKIGGSSSTKFTKETSGDIVNDSKPSRGASWGDYNNDRYLDMFVSNRHGNTTLLYTNNGDGTFTGNTTDTIVKETADAEGSVWVDVDNDGWLDLFMVSYGTGANRLYMNNGDGTFTKNTTSALLSSVTNGTGTSWADYDNDGDMDAFITSLYQSILYENNTSGNNYLKIKCEGTASNTSAYGARVEIKTTVNGKSMWQIREVTSQSAGSYGGQNDQAVHFGLGAATAVDSIIIKWPSGIVWDTVNISANSSLNIKERAKVTAISPRASAAPELNIYPNPANDIVYIRSSEKLRSVSVYNQLGQVITTRTVVGENMARLDISQLAQGIYIIKGVTDIGIINKQIVVQH